MVLCPRDLAGACPCGGSRRHLGEYCVSGLRPSRLSAPDGVLKCAGLRSTPAAVPPMERCLSPNGGRSIVSWPQMLRSIKTLSLRELSPEPLQPYGILMEMGLPVTSANDRTALRVSSGKRASWLPASYVPVQGERSRPGQGHPVPRAASQFYPDDRTARRRRPCHRRLPRCAGRLAGPRHARGFSLH